MDIADIMVDMDIHMVMAVMDMHIVLMDMDIVDTDIGVKPSSHYYQSYLRNALQFGIFFFFFFGILQMQ